MVYSYRQTQDFKRFTDEELVESYRDGNEQAFTELYVRYERKLKRLIYYYIPDAEEASDVFHDAIMRVFRHLGSFDTGKSFSSWIYQIAINCSKNYLGKTARDIRMIEEERFRLSRVDGGKESPEEIYISESDMAEFNRSVSLLKEKFRTVFLLRYDQKLKYSDIAKILRCSERTAKWRMEKAIKAIARHLSEKGVI
ncbi:MAG: sigma-70 family RNA polymerase sigma factor [Spirochaetes bacterium]|nr:sigma-70 family RNA polymerase sigma factor [Spirochaetota bacterium]